jgi:hypothetical protein
MKSSKLKPKVRREAKAKPKAQAPKKPKSELFLFNADATVDEIYYALTGKK